MYINQINKYKSNEIIAKVYMNFLVASLLLLTFSFHFYQPTYSIWDPSTHWCSSLTCCLIHVLCVLCRRRKLLGTAVVVRIIHSQYQSEAWASSYSHEWEDISYYFFFISVTESLFYCCMSEKFCSTWSVLLSIKSLTYITVCCYPTLLIFCLTVYHLSICHLSPL